MKEYLDIVQKVVDKGVLTPNRTGINAYAVVGGDFEHDMKDGFPLITTKKMPFRSIASELEFFIKGLTDKKWLQDRKNYIWDEWANPEEMQEYYVFDNKDKVKKNEIQSDFNDMIKLYTSKFIMNSREVPNKLVEQIELLKPYFTDMGEEHILNETHLDDSGYVNNKTLIREVKTLGQMLERDLGPVYGWQWRHWGAKYYGTDFNYRGEGIDQLENLVNKLKHDPYDRSMYVNAWQPEDFDKMGLKPCHYGFYAMVLDNKLNIIWDQRSVDTMIGLPFNIASYGLLLHLLAKETGLEEGVLKGSLKNVHIYENHMEKAKEQLTRDPNKFKLPSLVTENFKSIFDWKYTDTKIVDYKSYDKIDFGKIAV